jgi:hypothetical protein
MTTPIKLTTPVVDTPATALAPAPAPAAPAHVTGTTITTPATQQLKGSPAELDANGRLQVETVVAPSIAGVNLAAGQTAPTLSKGAVAGYADSGIGVWGHGSPAGYFEGDVTVTGTLSAADVTTTGTVTAADVILPNADCAEDFDVSAIAEPGDVMVLDGEGALCACAEPYDRKAAGVISGAGDYRPAIRLDRRPSSTRRLPIALVGKVFCKVDARYGAVAVGDLLTTSATPGHAMKASDPSRAFGAIIGKALRPLAEGQGLIPILVALQ